MTATPPTKEKTPQEIALEIASRSAVPSPAVSLIDRIAVAITHERTQRDAEKSRADAAILTTVVVRDDLRRAREALKVLYDGLLSLPNSYATCTVENYEQAKSKLYSNPSVISALRGLE